MPPGLPPASTTTSNPVLIGAVVAIAAFGTAAVLFVGGDVSLQRLGLLFALLGTASTGLLAALRSDHAATQTSGTSDIATALNGDFEARVAAAVGRALAVRRASDPVVAAEAAVTDPPPDAGSAP